MVTDWSPERPGVPRVDLASFRSELSFRHKALRAVWTLVWLIAFRPSPRPLFGWRRMLLKVFGAKVGRGARVYNSVRVYYPPLLDIGDQAVVGTDVDLYNVDRIELGTHSMISQYSVLCTASHDYTQGHLPLVTAPIVIGSQAWVCADVFVGPGVTVGEGTVVGARSSLFRDAPSWSVMAGNPAQKIRDRTLQPPAEGRP